MIINTITVVVILFKTLFDRYWPVFCVTMMIVFLWEIWLIYSVFKEKKLYNIKNIMLSGVFQWT